MQNNPNLDSTPQASMDLPSWEVDANDDSFSVGSVVSEHAKLQPQSNAPEVKLNDDQAAAVTALLDFISDPDPSNWVFVLSGYAGTGKTFCMREVAARCEKSAVNIVYTAPTNKAAKVLRKQVGSACTIYSLLNLRVDKSGELKEVMQGKPVDLSDVDVIVVDEGSMVNLTLMRHLEDQARKFMCKVIFMGDPAQLPPVKEAASPIWKLESAGRSLLTRVMRHDNQVLNLVTAIRGQIDSLAPCFTPKSDNDAAGGVFKLTRNQFKEQIYAAACRGEFADGSQSKVIAWRNVRVGEYNDVIRAAIFGADAVPGFYLPGDRIVAAGPCMRGDVTILTTDDEAIVERAKDCKHPLEPKYNGIELQCRTEDNRVIRLLVIHPSSVQQFNNDSEMLAHEARGNGKLWKRFWEHKELFHDLKYAYALTAHRSQGSTYENAFVDFQDILYNRNRREAFQCLYVACSRPTTRLYLA